MASSWFDTVGFGLEVETDRGEVLSITCDPAGSGCPGWKIRRSALLTCRYGQLFAKELCTPATAFLPRCEAWAPGSGGSRRECRRRWT